MAESRLIQKQLAGKEDLLLGVGTVSQARATGVKTITKLNATHFGGVLVVDTINDLNSLDKNQLDEQVVLVKEDGNTYIYNGTSWVTKTTAIVENIGGLKTLSAGAIEVLGYYTKGDGGGGTFYWDSTSTETDNGGTIIQATGITTGRWKRLFGGVVNAKWFGFDTIIFDGDSITEGNAIGFKYSEWLETLSYCNDNNINTYNYAIGGAVITGTGGDGNPNNNLNYRYPISIYPKRPASKGGSGKERVYLHILIGTNDLDVNYGNKSASTVISELTTYVSVAKNDGFTVLLSTILPRKTSVNNWSISKDNERKLVNKAILDGTIGADIVIDLASVITDTSDSIYFQDGIHPTILGAKQIANKINTVLVNNNTDHYFIGSTLHNYSFNGKLEANEKSYLSIGNEYMKTMIGSDNGYSTGFMHFIDLNDTRIDTKRWLLNSGFTNKLQLSAINDNGNVQSNIMSWSRTGMDLNYTTDFRGKFITADSSAYISAGVAFNKTYLGHFNGSGAGYIINENLTGLGGDSKYAEIMQDNNNRFCINFVNEAVTDSKAVLQIWRNGYTPTSFNVGTHISPIIDNAYNVGGASNRWGTIYLSSGTINTSDDREKTYLTITDVEKQVAMELKANMKKFKFNSAITEKGESGARIHFGASAQTVKSIFEKYGLNGFDYAVLCYDEWEEQEVKDEEENIIEPYRPAGNRYGIRYEELLCFIISAM